MLSVLRPWGGITVRNRRGQARKGHSGRLCASAARCPRARMRAVIGDFRPFTYSPAGRVPECAASAAISNCYRAVSATPVAGRILDL